MKQHLSFLKYLLRHKFYVFVAGVKIGVNWWQLLVHDWRKFTPAEWFGYVKAFSISDRKQHSYNDHMTNFKYAWNHHQKHCKHHWQYWILIWGDRDENQEILKIPIKYVKEMVADWCGAGKAKTGQWDINEWYAKNIDRMILHPETKNEIERLLVKWNQTIK